MKYTTLLIAAIATFTMQSVIGGPNLVPDLRNFSIQMGYQGYQTEIEDGCIPAGTHNVLRFDFLSKNLGNADFVVGKPADRPDLFYFSQAHQHYHMREFNQYKLFDTVTGKLVVPSTKPGFCLADGEQVLPNAGPAKFSITCRANDVMGISAGWADVYAADRECQYLVIDGIPNGNYTLVAITNTAHAVAEDSFDDNAVSRGLLIEGDTVVEFMTTTPPSHFLNPSDSLSATSSTLSNTTTSVQGSTTSASPTSATISTTTPSILPTTTTSVQESHTAVAAVVSTTSTVASSSSVGAVPSQSASAASQGSFVQEFIATLAVLALTFVVL